MFWEGGGLFEHTYLTAWDYRRILLLIPQISDPDSIRFIMLSHGFSQHMFLRGLVSLLRSLSLFFRSLSLSLSLSLRVESIMPR